jgi:hypothetical protein
MPATATLPNAPSTAPFMTSVERCPLTGWFGSVLGARSDFVTSRFETLRSSSSLKSLSSASWFLTSIYGPWLLSRSPFVLHPTFFFSRSSMILAQLNSVARIASPAGMTTIAGPGNTTIKAPINKTLTPKMPTTILRMVS